MVGVTKNANTKKWTVVLASLFAAGILGATLYFGGPGASSSGNAPIVILDPDELPGRSNPGQEGTVTKGQGIKITIQQPGRELELTADSLEPIEGGSNFVENPVVRVFFEGREQHMELRADRGTVYMPADNPKSGRMMGNVFLTLFEPPVVGSVPDWDDISQVVMHLRLDDADFDLERGEIYSRSPLDLYTPTSEFHGVGLRLVFNQVRNRLEHLRIDKGDFLRVYQGSSQMVADATEAPQQPAVEAAKKPGAQNTEMAASKPKSADQAATGGVAKVKPAQPKAAASQDVAQFYEATFEDDIQIDTVNNAYSLRGDLLSLLFGVESEPESTTPGGRGKRNKDPLGGLGLARPSSALPMSVAQALTSSNSASLTEISRDALVSITAKGPEDVVLRWSGPMVIRPNPNKPDELIDAKDLHARLSGDKATLWTQDGATVSGGALAYTRASEHIFVQRGPRLPVELISPGQGTMVGGDLFVDGLKGQGQMKGPVQLTGDRQWVGGGEVLSQTGQNALAGDVPQDAEEDVKLYATADGGMNFVMFPRTPEAPEASGAAVEPANKTSAKADSGRNSSMGDPFGGKALKRVELFENVRVVDPRMTAESEQLTLLFKPQSDGGQAGDGESRLSRVTAKGDVSVMVMDEAEERPLWISSDWLSLGLLDTSADQTVLDRLLAEGDVTVSSDQLLLDTQRLDAQFVQNGTNANGKTDTALGLTHAYGGVQAVIETQKPGEPVQVASLAGDRLALEPAEEVLTALGGLDTPAILSHKGSELAGPVVRLDGLGRQASVWGAGSGRVPMQDEIPEAIDKISDDAALADGTDKTSSSNGVFLTTWTRGMAVSEGGAYGAVMGDAKGMKKSPLESSEMAGELLRLDLESEPNRGPMWSAVDAAEKQARAEQPFGGGLKRVVAIGKGKVFGQQLADTDGQAEQPVSRLWIEGPRIVADILQETLTVPDAGFMLIEDYSELAGAGSGNPVLDAASGTGVAAAPVVADQAAEATRKSDKVELTGQGATTLTWKDRMVLDASTNDATLEGGVVMTHAPLLPNGTLDYENKAKLFCDLLKVDMVETGGLAVWTSDEASQPEIRHIACDHNVEVQYGPQRVNADYLRYTAAEEVVWFTADPGRRVRFDDVERGTGLANRWVKWSLPTNTFVGQPVGPTIVPIRGE